LKGPTGVFVTIEAGRIRVFEFEYFNKGVCEEFMIFRE
jgi:hypothetical protein